MPEKITKDDGTEVEMYSKEDYEALATAKTEAETAATEARRVAAEQTTNFKKVNEMSEEEKKAFDANTIALMQRADKTASENEELRQRLDAKEIADKAENKNSIASYYHQGDEKVKTDIEISYAALAGMPETTKEEIGKRYEAAAKLAGIQVNSGPNPLYSPVNGEAPRSKEAKEFVETTKGTEAADMVRAAMGIKKPEEKK